MDSSLPDGIPPSARHASDGIPRFFPLLIFGAIVAAGHRLRVYVPYGAQWYAYSVRRLKENPRIAGYVFQNILRKFTPNGKGRS